MLFVILVFAGLVALSKATPKLQIVFEYPNVSKKLFSQNCDLARKWKDTVKYVDSRKDRFNGLVSVLPNGHHRVLSHSVGYANIENKVAFKTASMFPIASNTKLFIATSIYQLQEKGLLRVSDQVNDYLDREDFVKFGFPRMNRWCPKVKGSQTCMNISFIQLMEMSSGIFHSLNCDEPESPYCYRNTDNFYVYNGNIAGYVGVFINAPLEFIPGTQFSYANTNYVLLSYLIEKLSGLSLHDYVKTNIFDFITPDRPDDVIYDPYGGLFDNVPYSVDSYRAFVNNSTQNTESIGTCRPYFSPGFSNGAGGFWATTEALMDFYQVMFDQNNLGGDILTSESVMEILKPRQHISNNSYYGQGVIVRYKNETFPSHIFHSGRVPCASTNIMKTINGIFASFNTMETVIGPVDKLRNTSMHQHDLIENFENFTELINLNWDIDTIWSSSSSK